MRCNIETVQLCFCRLLLRQNVCGVLSSIFFPHEMFTVAISSEKHLAGNRRRSLICCVQFRRLHFLLALFVSSYISTRVSPSFSLSFSSCFFSFLLLLLLLFLFLFLLLFLFLSLSLSLSLSLKAENLLHRACFLFDGLTCLLVMCLSPTQKFKPCFTSPHSSTTFVGEHVCSSKATCTDG